MYVLHVVASGEYADGLHGGVLLVVVVWWLSSCSWWLVALFMLLVVGGSQHAFGGWWPSTCTWWPADVMVEYAQLLVWIVWTKQNVLHWMESVFRDFNINFLIILMTTLLITPTLNSTNLLATSFALHLLKADRSTKKQLFALVSPKDGTKISKSLEPYLEGGQLNILFGSTNSQKIVKRVVEVNEIRSVYVIIDDKSNIADEENKDLKSQSFASKTRSFLTSLCSLLDCFRQTSAIPSIVVLFHSFGTVKEEFLLPHLDICLPLHPLVQCKTEKSARFSSLHALCHAFAVSYKMNIHIGLVMETTELICNQHVFFEFEALASLKSMEKSEIYFFEIGRIGGDEEIFNFTRLLLFSNVKLEEQQKQQAIQSLSSSQMIFSMKIQNLLGLKCLLKRLMMIKLKKKFLIIGRVI
uniref:Uncharacterized protein n=1 Tax=Meloidogyne enterolobii TaxID=390850 RepID=A0A6V7VBN8_MELEN|nr:unnamed protein product [Meloidogyne enterolobii]